MNSGESKQKSQKFELNWKKRDPSPKIKDRFFFWVQGGVFIYRP
ncbi:MAG: hypothetical protein ACI83H_002266 [Glaciecola sp.]|jgi:hypothetical protein